MAASVPSARYLLQFEDFLESLCRMSDLRSAPSSMRMRKMARELQQDYVALFERLEKEGSTFPRRKSGDWGKPNTRPVGDKLRWTVPSLLCKLCAVDTCVPTCF